MDKPTWIGVEIEGINTTVKICIGLNMEDGHEVTWRMSEDEHWCWDNVRISIKEDENARVFDDENNLI